MEEFLEYFKEKKPGKRIVRLVGPNYIYFANGSIVKVYFDDQKEGIISGLTFPLHLTYLPYLRILGLMRIREDLVRIRKTL